MCRLWMGILCLVLPLMLSCKLSSARNDPGGGPAGEHRYRPQCKLCLVVALPIAAGAVAAAAAVVLICCILRRRKKDAAVAAAGTVHKGRRSEQSSSLTGGGVASEDYNPARSTASSSSWNNSGYDNPKSINPTMVRSPNPSPSSFRFWGPGGSSSPSPSPSRESGANHHRSPAGSAGSPLRRSSAPAVPRPPKKPEEKAVTGDPLALYSPSISARLKEFDYEQLEAATGKFGKKSQLGRRGGPWVVFKGTKFVKDEGLPATVAIKRFHTTFGEEQCKRIRGELKSMSTLRHKNLVSLLGYSLGKGRFHLVYDYMTNGSLEKHHFPESSDNRGSRLSWPLRYSIVKDVAQGLYQLHVTNTPHGSIRASSIMLDHDSTARLDDHFGYRPLQESDHQEPNFQSIFNRVRAERMGGSETALQQDIADLGAVVLELVSGRRHGAAAAVFVGQNKTATPLDDWVWTLNVEGCLLSEVDAALEDEFNQAQAAKLLLLGLACRHPDPKMRPKIHDVRMLLLDKNLMPEVPSSKPTSAH